MTRQRWQPTALLLLIFGLAQLSAHDTREPPVVDVLIRPDGAHLTVEVHMPVAALSDIDLPRDANGQVSQGVDEPLQLVGREVASSLDVEQGGERLAPPSARTTLAADGTTVVIDLVYLLRTDKGAISARLQTHRAGRDLVPTVAHYVVSPGVIRSFVQTGDAERVLFAPTPLQTMRDFFFRAARVVATGWGFLVFALCLAVPLRRHRSLRSAAVAVLAGEALGSLLTASGSIVPGASSLAVAEALAASTLVMASLQGVTGGPSRWLWPLALAFGATSGIGLGETFRQAVPLAGDFAVLAYACFLLVVLGGQLWMLGLVSSAAGLLYSWGVPERLAAMGVAVYAGHAGLHALGEGAATVASSTALTADQFLATLTVVWALIVIGAGVLETFRPNHEPKGLRAAGGPAR